MAWPALILVAVSAGCPTCPLVDPPPVADCDLPAPTVHAFDSCRGTPVATLSLMRKPGPPNSASTTFELGALSDLCIIVTSLPNASGVRTAATWVTLDGAELFRTSDSNANDEGGVRRSTVDAGTHELTAIVAAAPGASIVVEVRAVGAVTADHVAAAEELARLERLSCEELNDSVDLLGPELVEREVAILESLGIPPGRLRVHYSAYGVPRYVSPLPALSPPGTTLEEIAGAWLEDERVIFRLDDPRHVLVPGDVTTRTDGSARAVFQQLTDGLRVEPGLIYVSIDPLGEVRKVVAAVAPDVNPDQPIVLTPTEAAVVARTDVGALPGTPTDVELAYLDLALVRGRPGVELAYRVVPEYPGLAVWVDATDGSVLLRGRTAVSAAVKVFDPAVGLDPVVADTTEPAPWYTADCDESCQRVLQAATIQLGAWVLRGRDGWAGPGFAPFPVMMDVDPIGPGDDLEIWLSPDPAETARWTQGNFMWLGPGMWRHWDIVWHETCHGANRVNLRTTPIGIVEAGDEMMAISEHLADLCAMLLDAQTGLGDNPLAMERFGFPYDDRNHGIDGCAGYAATDYCDFVPPGLDVGPMALGCREYYHLGNFLQTDDGGAEEHLNSCTLTRPWSLLMRPGTTPFRGIAVVPMDVDLLDLAYTKLSESHLSAVDSIFTYAEAVRDAALELDAFCLLPHPPGTPCDTVPAGWTIPEQMELALEAAGFWSPPVDIGTSAPAGSIGAVHLMPDLVPPGVTTPDLLFFAAGPMGNRTLHVFQDNDGLYEFTIPGFEVDLGISTGDEVSASAWNMDYVVAFTDPTSGEARVGTATHPGSLSIAPLPGIRPAFSLMSDSTGRIAVAMAATETFLAYVDDATGELRWLLLSDPGNPQPLATGASPEDVTLFHDRATGLLHLFYTDGVFSILRHRLLNTADVAAGWSSVTTVTHMRRGLEDIDGLAPVSLPTTSEVRPGGPPAVVRRGGSLQLTYRSSVTYLTIPLDGAGAPDFAGASRELRLADTGGSGVGLLVHGVSVVAIWQETGGLRHARKRSE